MFFHQVCLSFGSDQNGFPKATKGYDQCLLVSRTLPVYLLAWSHPATNDAKMFHFGEHRAHGHVGRHSTCKPEIWGLGPSAGSANLLVPLPPPFTPLRVVTLNPCGVRVNATLKGALDQYYIIMNPVFCNLSYREFFKINLCTIILSWFWQHILILWGL